MGYDIFEEVDRLLEVVDDAVVSGDFTNLKDHVGEIVEPMKKNGYDKRFFENQRHSSGNQRTNGSQGKYNAYRGQGSYNAGHMENRGNAFHGTYSQNRYYGDSRANTGYNPQRSTAGTVPRYSRPQNQARRIDPLRDETELFKKVESSLGNQIKQVIGFTGAALSGLVALIFLVVTIGIFGGVGGAAGAVGAVFTLFSLGVTAAFVALAMSGRKGIQKMQRYIKYRSVLMKKSFASVKELAEAVNVPEEKVVAELKELTAMGFFKQGHFDKKETTFICADEIYRLYQQSEESERIRRQEEEERMKQAGYIPEEVRELLDKGNEYVKMIHQANEKIPGAEVSEKLDRMENIVARIFVEVQKNPSLAGNLNMFMDYYLPTTTKLMDAYIEMDSNPMQGDNIQKSKKEIEGTLDTINDAFEALLDSFFKEKALDLSTDISVMKNMMRQQGLTPDELEMIRRQQDLQFATSPTIGEAQAYMRKKEEPSYGSAPTLENIRQQLAEEDARKARGEKEKEATAEPEFEYTAPTLEDVRKQLAEEDARAAREAAAKAAEEDKKKADTAEERPLSFDEQLELEAEQGLLMTGNGDDDDIF